LNFRNLNNGYIHLHILLASRSLSVLQRT